MGVYFRSVDRTVRPEKRSSGYTIPGRSGAYRVEDGTFEEREIRCRLSFLGEVRTRESLRERVRAVAAWLSGKGKLIFDDEPGAAYRATVLESISLEQIASAGFCDVRFLCEPFAESVGARGVQASEAPAGTQLTMDADGSSPTDCRIVIRACGSISNLYINLMYRV